MRDYESFIYKSSFLHSSSKDLQRTYPRTGFTFKSDIKGKKAVPSKAPVAPKARKRPDPPHSAARRPQFKAGPSSKKGY